MFSFLNHTQQLRQNVDGPYEVIGKINEILNALAFLVLTQRMEIDSPHCEIFGSYLQQHHQHPVFRVLFQAEAHSDGKANEEKYLPIGLQGTS